MVVKPSTKGFDDIPLEVVWDILELAITRKNFHSISLVCKQWSSIIQSLLLKVISMNRTSVAHLREVLNSRPSQLDWIRVIFLEMAVKNPMEPQVLQEVLNATAPYLLELRLTQNFRDNLDEDDGQLICLPKFSRLKDLYLSHDAPGQGILLDIFPDLPYTSTLRSLSLANFKLGYGAQAKEVGTDFSEPTFSPCALALIGCSDSDPKTSLERLFSPSLSRLDIITLWDMTKCIDLKYALFNYLIQANAPIKTIDIGVGELDMAPGRGLTRILNSFGESLQFLEIYSDRIRSTPRLPTSFLSSLPPRLLNFSLSHILRLDFDDNLLNQPKGTVFPNLQRLRLCDMSEDWRRLITAPTFDEVSVVGEYSDFWRLMPCFCERYREFGHAPLADEYLTSYVFCCQFCTAFI